MPKFTSKRSTADGLPPTPPPPQPDEIVTDAQRARERLVRRAEEIRGGHWQIGVCGRGHTVEYHRTNAATDGPPRCPMCRDLVQIETPLSTATREQRAASTPQALVARLADTLADWAHEHLHSARWTQLSDAQRAARQRAGGEPGVRSPFDL